MHIRIHEDISISTYGISNRGVSRDCKAFQARIRLPGGGPSLDLLEGVIVPATTFGGLSVGHQAPRHSANQRDPPDPDMRQGALDEVMVGAVAYLTGVRLSCLPGRVEIEKGDRFGSGAVGMGPVMQPWPVFTVGIQVEGGAVLGGGIRGADTSHPPAQLHVRFLKLLAALFELGEERTRFSDCVGDRNFQLTDGSRSGEMSDHIYGVAILKAYEGCRKNLISDIG